MVVNVFIGVVNFSETVFSLYTQVYYDGSTSSTIDSDWLRFRDRVESLFNYSCFDIVCGSSLIV